MSKKTIIAYIGLLIVVLVAYLPVFRAGFVMDDEELLVENRLIKQADGVWKYWSTRPSTDTPDYWPLTNTSLWLEYRLWGLEKPWGYHLTNLLLHALSVMLLWRVLIRLRVPGAYVAAMLFAVHPACVDTVAWISERKNVLSMVFYLWTVLEYIRFVDAGKKRSYVLSILAFVIALLSKTSGVLLPLLLPFLVWWEPWKINAKKLLPLVPFIAVSLVLGLVTIFFQHGMPMGYAHELPYTLADRIVGSGVAMWFYLSKALFPVRLSFVYPRWDIGGVHVLGWPMVFACIAFLFWRCRAKWARALLLGLGWFGLMLLPASGIIEMRWMVYSIVADHFLYMALPGIVALAVGFGRVLMERNSVPRNGMVVVAGLLVLMLGVGTFMHARTYRDNISLWENVVRRYPGRYVGYVNLGVELEEQQKHGEALENLSHALAIKKDSALIHHSMSTILRSLGQHAASAGEARQAIALWEQRTKAYPELELGDTFPRAEMNLAYALAALGEKDEAIKHAAIAVETCQNDFKVFNNIGTLLVDLGRPDLAERVLAAAVKLFPDSFMAHYNLGRALAALGRHEEALQFYNNALKLQPGNMDAYNNIGVILTTLNRNEEARQCFGHIIQNDPGNPRAYNNYGQVMHRMGKPIEAIPYYERALQIEPNYVDALYNCAAGYNMVAAYHAEQGRKDEAIRIAKSALELAKRGGHETLAGEIEKRLKEYEVGK